MEQALHAINGIEFRFTVERFGSLARAKERATSLQNQVSSIRARARNTAAVRRKRMNHEITGEQLPGRYDALVCFKRLLPDEAGYVVVIGPATSQEDDFEIYDRATGKQIVQADPRELRVKALIDHLGARMQAGTKPYLNYEEEKEFYELNPDVFRSTYEFCGLPLPAWISALDALVEHDRAEPFDPLNTPMDEFGV